MRKIIELDYKEVKSHRDLDRVFTKAFPSYRGRKFRVCITDSPLNVKSCWDGGSRDYFAFVRLVDGKFFGEVGAQSAFDKPIKGAESVSLPQGMGCVEHSIFCGKDMGLTLYLNPQDSPKLLEVQEENLSEDEAIVLLSTSKYKNTYGGESNLRFKYAKRAINITLERWNQAIESCISKGLLRKNKAITPKGRNAVNNPEFKELGYKI